MWSRLVLGLLLIVVPGMGRELRLVKTVPVSELKDGRGVIPKILGDEVSFEPASKGDPVQNDFGFVRMGSSLFFYTGFNGMVVDLESGQMKQALPPGLSWAKISYSGERVVGSLDHDKRFWSMHNGQAKECKAEEWTWWMRFGWIHPADQVFFVPDGGTRHPYPPYNMKGVLVVDLNAGKILGHVPIHTEPSQRSEPSRDGKLVFGGLDPYTTFKAQNAQTGKRLEFELPDEAYLSYVYNRNASLVAGGYGNKGRTFLWDRIKKKFTWEKDPNINSVQTSPGVYEDKVESWGWGTPSAFSHNDQYLLCQGVIVKSANGKIEFSNLKGKRGKFSPDGRSLVTVDDEAFYVYTLPKESEPIFGVFQKPEPWSPPKAPSSKDRKRSQTK